MQSVTNLKEYTPEHDAIMNTEMEVVHGVYPGTWNPNHYSIKVSDLVAKGTEHYTMDGSQMSYDRANVEDKLDAANIKYSALSDYPRHNNTLRLLFATEAEATNALNLIN